MKPFPVIILSALSLLPGFSWAEVWPESPTATHYSEAAKKPYTPGGGTEEAKAACKGGATQLQISQVRAKLPKHDMDLGQTTLTLLGGDGQKQLLQDKFAELWDCLGYNAKAKRYVLVSKNEHGVKVTLRGLVYLEENPPRFRESNFGFRQFEAAASLLSPDGTYLALIGAPAGKDEYRLYVLNLVTDQLLTLGQAPAPPPLTKEELASPEAADMMGAWEAPERHYAELEKEIWSFDSPGMLKVSYGKDTLQARGAKRTTVTYDLKRRFNSVKNLAPKKPSKK